MVAGLLCGLPGSAPFSLSPALFAGGPMRHPPLSPSLGRFPASALRLMRPRTCGLRMVDAQDNEDERGGWQPREDGETEKSGTQFFTVSKPVDGSRSIEAELEFRSPRPP
jgi:hypothetical protein